jgi:hypothetical protein
MSGSRCHDVEHVPSEHLRDLIPMAVNAFNLAPVGNLIDCSAPCEALMRRVFVSAELPEPDPLVAELSHDADASRGESPVEYDVWTPISDQSGQSDDGTGSVVAEASDDFSGRAIVHVDVVVPLFGG